MSVRYTAVYCLVWSLRHVRRLLWVMLKVTGIPERFAVLVWKPDDIDRFSKRGWEGWPEVTRYTRLESWLDSTEQALVERHFTNRCEVLNLACGAGREALLLAQRGCRVTAGDWSPRMIAAARRRASEDQLPIRFDVVDFYDLRYPDDAFDGALITNIAYSYFFPKRRRVGLLRQLYAVLKPGGRRANGRQRFVESLVAKVTKYPPFNRDYEPGDHIDMGTFCHTFRPDELKQEFDEAGFTLEEWLWDDGYAVLTKDPKREGEPPVARG